MTAETEIECLLRELAPQIVVRLVRRYGDFDSREDAVQEALSSAAQQWPCGRVPDNPKGWLIKVASRRLIEMMRSDAARRRREETRSAAGTPEGEAAPAEDYSLTLLLHCCNPSLTLPSQVALTFRAIGGLTTAEVARAFLVPESTIGQRISWAKQRIKASRLSRVGCACGWGRSGRWGHSGGRCRDRGSKIWRGVPDGSETRLSKIDSQRLMQQSRVSRLCSSGHAIA